MIRKILMETGLVIVIAFAVAIVSYLIRPELLPLVPPEPGDVPTMEDDQLYKEISFEQAQALFARRNALFADARPLIAYEAGHIQGAVHLDPHYLDDWADRLIAAYSPDQVIVTYCEGPRCTLSEELAEKLTWLGYEEVYYLVDGWGKWMAHQMPVN